MNVMRRYTFGRALNTRAAATLCGERALVVPTGLLVRAPDDVLFGVYADGTVSCLSTSNDAAADAAWHWLNTKLYGAPPPLHTFCAGTEVWYSNTRFELDLPRLSAAYYMTLSSTVPCTVYTWALPPSVRMRVQRDGHIIGYGAAFPTLWPILYRELMRFHAAPVTAAAAST